jgi:hypothetical protein
LYPEKQQQNDSIMAVAATPNTSIQNDSIMTQEAIHCTCIRWFARCVGMFRSSEQSQSKNVGSRQKSRVNWSQVES